MSEPKAEEGKQPLVKRAALFIWDLLCEHWFILGLGFAIGFAAAVPNFGRTGGWIRGEYTIQYGAVIVIFILSGLSLKTRVLATAAARVHFHLLVQFMSLVVTPAIGYGIASALGTSAMNNDLVKGLIVCTSMPTTISTNVVFTKQAGGNDASALINAVIGNLAGIFVTPGWLYLYLGRSAQAPYATVIQKLAITIIAPLVVGQAFQYWKPDLVKKLQEKVNFGKVGNVMILTLVWQTFCTTFHRKIHLAASSWVPMVFLEFGLYILFSILCLAAGTFMPIKRAFTIDKPDAVALTFCGATKTLALGMPLITALYGKNANAGILSLPLIIYHAEQILLGSLFISRLKAWTERPGPGAWPKLKPLAPPVGGGSADVAGTADGLPVTAPPAGPGGPKQGRAHSGGGDAVGQGQASAASSSELQYVAVEPVALVSDDDSPSAGHYRPSANGRVH